MSIRLKLEGFDELLKEIEAAGQSMKSAVESTMKESAQTMQEQLKSEMRKANVPNDLVERMPLPSVTASDTNVYAEVGYHKGPYNPNDLSDGYKVVFLNYGTPNRKKHGKIQKGGKIKLGFIKRAKSKARPILRKQQEETLKKILSGLQK